MTYKPATAPENVRRTSTSSAEFNSLSVPTYRGSTITYPDYDSFVARGSLGRNAYTYGLAGTPTTRALADNLTALENGVDTFLTPSGLMAITVTFLALLKSGDRVLLPETVYGPVRRFAEDTMVPMGIEALYYDPTKPLDLDSAEVRLLWIESPGSITMEMQDIHGLATAARSRGILVGCDNSWASPLLCQPLNLGTDVVVEAVTKYLSGHSDLLLGSITARDEDVASDIHKTIRSLGVGVSPDDCFLALRGLETAPLRLAHVGSVAEQIAKWLAEKDPVAEVLMPALPKALGHDLWKAQYKGASGVFSIIMKPEVDERHRTHFENLRLFQIGASWGGTHSLVAPSPVTDGRCGGLYDEKRVVRLSIGLEEAGVLLEDLDRFLSDDKA